MPEMLYMFDTDNLDTVQNRSAFEYNEELEDIADNDDKERSRSKQTKERITKGLQLYRRLQKIPNVYTSTYYALVANEYTMPSNVYTLNGEDLYR